MTTLVKTNGIYQIKPGDTLQKVAESQGRTLADLLSLNPQFKANPSLVYPGQTVNLGTAPASTSQPIPGLTFSTPPPAGLNLASFNQTPVNFSPGMAGLTSNTPLPTTTPAPSYSGLTGGGSSGGGTSGGGIPSPTTGNGGGPAPTLATPGASFTESLIKLLKDAQERDITGQAALMKQGQGITGLGLNDAAMNFRNKYLSPNAGTSLGLSAQNEFDPLLLSIENQRKLASQNLGNITDLIKENRTAYEDEASRKSDDAYRNATLAETIRSNKADEGIKSSGGGSGAIKLTPTDKQGLLAAGLSAVEIGKIESDINSLGMEKVLSENLLTEAQKAAIMKAYGGAAGNVLTRATISSFFGIPDDNKGTFLGVGKTNSTKLNDLMSFVERYRAIGYDDDAILKLMLASQKK